MSEYQKPIPEIFVRAAKNTTTIFTVLLLMCGFSRLSAQHKMTIAYGEKLHITHAKNLGFDVSGPGFERHFKGEAINGFSFDKPGSYRIVASNLPGVNSGYEEDDFPKIDLTVSNAKMIFDGNSITLSRPIIKNQDTEGTILSISVSVSTYDHASVRMNPSPVTSAGIGTTLTAIPESLAALSEGTHVLKYRLHGTSDPDSHIMLDFTDCNGQVQSFTLPSPIKN